MANTAEGTATSLPPGQAAGLEALDAAAKVAEANSITHEVKVPTGESLGSTESEAQRMIRILNGQSPRDVFRTDDERIGVDPAKASPADHGSPKRDEYVNPHPKTVVDGLIPGQRRASVPEAGAEPVKDPTAPAAPQREAAKPAPQTFDEAALKKEFGLDAPTAKPEDEMARLRAENEQGKQLWRNGVNELRAKPVDALLDDLKVDPQAIVNGLRARGLLNETATAPVSALPADLKLPEDASDLEKALLAENRALKLASARTDQRLNAIESRTAQRESGEEQARRDADVSRRFGTLANTVASKVAAIPAFQGETAKVNRIVENVLLRTERQVGPGADLETITKIGLQHAFDEVRLALSPAKAFVAAEAARGVAAPVPTRSGETVRPISGGARTRGNNFNFADDDQRRSAGLAELARLAGE